MNLIGFLLGREEDLREIGLNVRPLYSVLAVALFFAFHASSLSMLGARLACSSTAISERVLLFIKAKQILLLYAWVITAVSWGFTSTLIGIRVARRSNMRLRKYHYLMGMCSVPLAISGAVNTIILALSPGRILSCEGNSWKSLLLGTFSEIVSYLSSFPPILSALVTLLSLSWFTYLAFRVYRVSVGLPRVDSFKYSLGFASVFIGLIFLIGFILSLFTVLLP